MVARWWPPPGGRRQEMPRRMTVLIVAAVTALGGLAIAVPSSAAAPAPPGLDHFLCYSATPVAGVPGFQVPKGVTLKNQFSPDPFRPKFVTVDTHCNPASKFLATRRF